MTHAALSPLIGPEFDEFLGASIGEDQNGTGLSVLSALARLDVDPWQEATSLARMPREAAAVRLTELIDALPHEPAIAIPSKMSAAALVALLPKVKTPNVPSVGQPICGNGLTRDTGAHRIERLGRDDAHCLRDLRLLFAWARERRESAGASRRRRLNGHAPPIKTGSETRPPARTNWRLRRSCSLFPEQQPNSKPLRPREAHRARAE